MSTYSSHELCVERVENIQVDVFNVKWWRHVGEDNGDNETVWLDKTHSRLTGLYNTATMYWETGVLQCTDRQVSYNVMTDRCLTMDWQTGVLQCIDRQVSYNTGEFLEWVVLQQQISAYKEVSKKILVASLTIRNGCRGPTNQHKRFQQSFGFNQKRCPIAKAVQADCSTALARRWQNSGHRTELHMQLLYIWGLQWFERCDKTIL